MEIWLEVQNTLVPPGNDAPVLLRIPQLGHAMALVHSEPGTKQMTLHPKTGSLMVKSHLPAVSLLFKTNDSQQLFGVIVSLNSKSSDIDIAHVLDSETWGEFEVDHLRRLGGLNDDDYRHTTLQGADRMIKYLPDGGCVSVSLRKRAIDDRKYIIVDLDFSGANTIPRHWNKRSQTWEI